MNIFLSSIVLLVIIYSIGYLCVRKEKKDTWGESKTMEIKLAEQLSKNWTKKHPILDFFQNCYYEIKRTSEVPMDTYRAIKWFIQRGKRGYSDNDIWGFYDYLAEIISKGANELERQVHGVPGELAEKFKDKDDPNGIDNAIVEWKRILREIAWTFEAVCKINSHDWVMIFDERSRNKYTKFYNKLNLNEEEDALFEGVKFHYHVMTKEECVRYKNGWKLFQKYYFNLWD